MRRHEACTAARKAPGRRSCGVDKWKARHDRWRVPERAFFCVALLGGTPGALLGMWTFRHKTRHWYFRYGLPALLLVQLALGTWIAIRVF